jgi:hypothetical protein
MVSGESGGMIVGVLDYVALMSKVENVTVEQGEKIHCIENTHSSYDPCIYQL